MPEGAVAPAGGGAEPQQRRRGGNFIGGIIRMGVTWYLMKNLMGGQKGPVSSNRDDQVWPAFNKSDAFDVFVFFNELPALPPSKWSDDEAVWVVRDLPLAGPGIDLSHNITYHPTEDVQRNGTLYAHAIFVAQGGALSPSSPDYDPTKIFHRVCRVFSQQHSMRLCLYCSTQLVLMVDHTTVACLATLEFISANSCCTGAPCHCVSPGPPQQHGRQPPGNDDRQGACCQGSC